MLPRSRQKKPSRKSRRRLTPARATGIVIVIVMLASAWHYWGRHVMAPEADSNIRPSANTLHVPPESKPPPTAPGQLKGRWVRPDGGYIIEINGIDSDGRLDARYYNPRPIHVSAATLVSEDGLAKIFIELRDVGYPGATYDLFYRSEEDLLVGRYFQPAVGQTFDVIFMRQKPAP